MRQRKVEAAIDWAYRASYCFAEEAAVEYATANGLTLVKEDLGQYGDKLAWTESLISQAARTGQVSEVDAIRGEISRLEAELARIAGEPLDLEHHDAPPGGAILEYAPALAEHGSRHWYADLEKAKAALLKLARDHGTTPDPDGLHVDLSPEGAQYGTTAWITRRAAADTPFAPAGSAASTCLERESLPAADALAESFAIERFRRIQQLGYAFGYSDEAGAETAALSQELAAAGFTLDHEYRLQGTPSRYLVVRLRRNGTDDVLVPFQTEDGLPA